MANDDTVLCVCENGAQVRIRDVDRNLQSAKDCYLVLHSIHKSLFGHISLGIEYSTGRFVVPLR